MLNKDLDFTFNHIDQVSDLFEVMSDEEIKVAFDSRGEELKTYIYTLVDALKSITIDDSGAYNIGISTIDDMTATNVQEALQGIKDLLDTLDTEKADKTELNNVMSAHIASADHDTRYYTKSELDKVLRGGDTLIRYEVFTIQSANNNDGTFTYKDKDDRLVIGNLTEQGYQIFALQDGKYELGQNRVTAIINDTFTRTPISGGLTEIDTTHVAITEVQENETEITIQYFERLGIVGTGLTTVSEENPGAGFLWYKVVG